MNGADTAHVYQLCVERHRAAATAVTSNREPAEWLALLADPLLAQSAIDRLVRRLGTGHRRRVLPAAAKTRADHRAPLTAVTPAGQRGGAAPQPPALPQRPQPATPGPSSRPGSTASHGTSGTARARSRSALPGTPLPRRRTRGSPQGARPRRRRRQAPAPSGSHPAGEQAHRLTGLSRSRNHQLQPR
jgi:hypothetical protein